MKKLISMSDFVLKEHNELHEKLISDYNRLWIPESYDRLSNYALFLKQPLTLGMFFPCDEKGNPIIMNGGIPSKKKYEDYEKAKEKVLFKDCEVKNIKATRKHDIDYFVVYYKSQQIWISWTERTIEDMIKNNLELSESAMKQIGI